MRSLNLICFRVTFPVDPALRPSPSQTQRLPRSKKTHMGTEWPKKQDHGATIYEETERRLKTSSVDASQEAWQTGTPDSTEACHSQETKPPVKSLLDGV